MIKVPVIFNHHSCEELSEEQKTSLFSGLAETIWKASFPKIYAVFRLFSSFPSQQSPF